MKVPFHYALQKLIIEAFSPASLAPAEIARRIAQAYSRPCSKEERKRLAALLESRGIEHVVHFTPLENVKTICEYGLIPREHLQEKSIRLVLGAQFTDQYRLDGRPEFNCLSVTFPNYRMFYSKRMQMPGSRWAVLLFSSDILTRYWAEFCPTNSASNTASAPGRNGMELQFGFPELRSSLFLAKNETTDPQAEILCDSVIPPSSIHSIYVERAHDAASLSRYGVSAVIEPSFFAPRHDFGFWKGKRYAELDARASDDCTAGGKSIG